jgi:hypothetical protein
MLGLAFRSKRKHAGEIRVSFRVVERVVRVSIWVWVRVRVRVRARVRVRIWTK